jgi:glutamate formiminotransferase
VRAVLECVVNISEGRRAGVVATIGAAGGTFLLDTHSDAGHHRSVLTLAGPAAELEAAVQDVARAAVTMLDLDAHDGAHPRLGVLDVVPFVDLDDPRRAAPAAIAARDRFAGWAGQELGLPCFLFGPERTLPEVRRAAFAELRPDTGPAGPHPHAGAAAVGARGVLVAYNLWLETADVATARAVAAAIRRPAARALGLDVGGRAQVSCNLIDPFVLGPEAVYDEVAARTPVARAELVGLVPAAVLEAVAPPRRAALDLDPERTIESRLRAAGLT